MPDVSGGVGADIAAERVLVAVDRDAPIGCLIGGMIDGMWHGANIAVSPSPAGTGVGSALMRFAVAQALRGWRGRDGLGKASRHAPQRGTLSTAWLAGLGRGRQPDHDAPRHCSVENASPTLPSVRGSD